MAGVSSVLGGSRTRLDVPVDIESEMRRDMNRTRTRQSVLVAQRAEGRGLLSAVAVKYQNNKDCRLGGGYVRVESNKSK